jgi:hypothetical protein
MITEEVLTALKNGEVVQFRRDAYQGWMFVQSVGTIIEYWYPEPVVPNRIKVMNYNWLLRMMVECEWCVKVDQRDWLGALEWIKEGKRVKRAGQKGGPQARLSHDLKAELMVLHYMKVEDFEAKDWVVADD